MQRHTTNPQRLNALAKSLAVLEAVTDQPQAIGLPDLAARLNLPRQTLHRVLVQLEKLKLIVRDPARERYSVGPRLSKLAFATLLSNNRGAPMRLVMQDLVADIRETCNLGVLDGLDYVYVERIECEWPLRIHVEVGDRVPAHSVSGGKLLLAYMDADQRRHLLKGRKLHKRTAKTRTKPADLEADFAKILSNGYATNNQENFDGIVAAAVPVTDAQGRVVASLTVHGPLPRLTLKACEAHVPRLLQAADRIGRVWNLP